MSELPLVSVITPSYNQAVFLEDTILSVLNQEYPHIEYIIIDGGSADNSTDIIRRYEERVAFWVSEPDRGQSHAINKGLRRATGDILTWLNSDDTFLRDTVRRAVDYLMVAPEVDVVYGRLNWIDSQGNLIASPSRFSKLPEFSLKTMIAGGIPQAGTFWRRPIMEKVGWLNETLNYIMDYDYWVRMALAGARFKCAGGEAVANRRMSEQAKTLSQNDKMGLEKLQFLDSLLADPALPEKLDLSLRQVKRQEMRARALACLRIFFAYSKRPGRRGQALRWLAKATRYHPPILFTRQFVKSLLYYRLVS
ncbi:MAG: glycosyltransferase [Chloroflexi bacterium]|nr:glycosyltransferase [Chloroflexota bacterium]MCI0725292.1 glycosyltransferase [Chloroflexota bacterium]